MQDLPNAEPGEVQPPANLQEINRCALNFRKLMLLFPYVHPAALHGVIVKHCFNWEQILPMLFAGQGARAEQFWDEVNGHKELEQALQRHGVRLVCCNGFRENQCFGQQALDEQPSTRCQHRPEAGCIHIIIEQHPPTNGQKDSVPKMVCEVETPNNDVIRIVLGEKSEGLVGKTPRTLEIVRNDSGDADQPAYIIRNVTESAAKESQTGKKTKRTQARAKAGEKRSRCRKPKLINTNEQNKTYNVQVENRTALASSKKGKASINTRVKSSKNTTNNAKV